MQGNLKNGLNALGTLFYMEMYLIKKIAQHTVEVDISNTSSYIFQIKGWNTKNILLSDDFYAQCKDGNLSYKNRTYEQK